MASVATVTIRPTFHPRHERQGSRHSHADRRDPDTLCNTNRRKQTEHLSRWLSISFGHTRRTAERSTGSISWDDFFSLRHRDDRVGCVPSRALSAQCKPRGVDDPSIHRMPCFELCRIHNFCSDCGFASIGESRSVKKTDGLFLCVGGCKVFFACSAADLGHLLHALQFVFDP